MANEIISQSRRDANPFQAIREHFDRDWAEFAEILLGPPVKREKQGKEWVYHCPFHSDETPSFGFNVHEGVYNCFGCGEHGDAIDLWARLRGCSPLEAAREIAQTFSIPLEDGEAPKLTLRGYASAKRLDLTKLKEWGLRDGDKGVEIPYYDGQGNEVAVRIRLAMRGDKRFCWRKGDKPTLYGLWRLKEWPREKLFVVEGESDCHTLWQVDIPAVGLPGVTVFKPEWAESLRSFKEIVIIQEPGARREVLEIAHKIRTRLGKAGPIIYALRLPVKDISELWMASPSPEAFCEALEEALLDWELLSFEKPLIKAEWLCYKQPLIHYRNQSFAIPYPYLIEHDRLIMLKPSETQLRREEIGSRLIIIGGRYRDEKGRLWTEVAWKSQDSDDWESQLVERASALDRKSLIELIQWGAPVNSENATKLVKFLAAFEEENAGKLKPKRASTHMGWVRRGLFLLGKRAIGGECRFIPLGEEEERLAEAYNPKGSLEEWRKLWERLPSAQARFIVAAHLAAPLVRLLGERSLLLYIYSESGLGKTALLHLGLAAWGNPEELKGTAYSTPVGMERRAELFSDLPLAIDERQAATSERFVDSMVYMLSGGQAKTRGAKEGGLQAVAQWRTVAIMTGEQDLTGSPWMGIENRTVQLYLPTLLDEELAREIYRATREHYGHIGEPFLKRLIELGEGKVKERAAELEEQLRGYGGIGGGKLALIALIGTAEELLLEVLGLPEEEGFAQALSDVGIIISQLAQEPKESLAERARDYILSKFAEFRAELRARHGMDAGPDERAFTEEEDGEELLYILPALFEEWLKKGGFTKKRVLKDWEVKGWIVTSEVSGKKCYTVRKRSPELWSKRNRYYCLRKSAMEGEDSNVPTSEKRQNAG